MTAYQDFYIHFKGEEGSEYSLIVNEMKIELNCYILGSPAGGTGTECGHEIESSKISEFLLNLKLNSIEEWEDKIRKYDLVQWRKLHLLMQARQTTGWIWNETD